MTIKVIQHKLNEDERITQKGNPITHLFKGDTVKHQHISFEGEKEFIDEYYKRNYDGGLTYIIGLPEYYDDILYKHESPDIKLEKPIPQIGRDMFLCITFYYDEAFYTIICQNSTVYIMSEGQTIDKIEC